MDGVGTSEGGFGDFGKAQEPDLTGGDQLRHGPDRLFDRHVRVDPVEVVQVDDIDLESGQAGLAGRADPVGTSIDADGPAGRRGRSASPNPSWSPGQTRRAARQGLPDYSFSLWPSSP